MVWGACYVVNVKPFAALRVQMLGVGACYLCQKTVLIDQGEYGFSLNNGRYEFLPPGMGAWLVFTTEFANTPSVGRHFLVSPLNGFLNQYSVGLQLIQEGPISIVRVPMGSYGFAFHNAKPEVLFHMHLTAAVLSAAS